MEVPGGLVVEGGPHRMLLSGEAASGFLPALLPLLDGRHDMDELCSLLAADPADLTQALELLDDWGVLEPGGPTQEEQKEGVPEDTVAYYSRTAALTGGHASAESVLDELSRSHVLLVAEQPLTRMLMEDLTVSGVGRVSTGGGGGGVPQNCDLVVVADRPGAAGRLADWVAAAWADRVPVLRLATEDGAVEVGPLFWPGGSACVGCFRRGGGPVGAAGGDEALLASAAAMEVLAVLARTTPVTTLGTRVRTVTGGDRTERHLLTPDPSCTVCGDGRDGAVDDALWLIEAYEWHLALPPGRLTPMPRLLAPQRHQVRQASRRRVLPYTSPAVRLPGPSRSDRHGGHPGPAGPVMALAEILPHMAGPTAAYDAGRGQDENGPVSVDTYVLTDLLGQELPGQVFRYDDVDHRLLSLRADSPPWRRAVLSSGLDVADLDAVIVLVADAGPLAAEFGDSAWRLAHLDAGIAAMRLAHAAREAQIPLACGLGWSEYLPAVLELDPTRESVGAVAGLVGGSRPQEVQG
ncbi:hypothetical protein [Streptomyces lincolnensis]|uniref:hypothetical protein n=1 Tax=Streptomyces lincolnensis TaxID=1915 RepID=UPI0012602BD5|nr:hypothetical protein [Streptomyces lincolnensis]QMV11652.1 hypothetical protein GJU35_42235 [Streptomyces lincolnensis]